MAPGLFKDAVPLMQAIEGDGTLVLPVCIDPVPRGSRIRGNVARLRLERPDDSLQAPRQADDQYVSDDTRCAGDRFIVY